MGQQEQGEGEGEDAEEEKPKDEAASEPTPSIQKEKVNQAIGSSFGVWLGMWMWAAWTGASFRPLNPTQISVISIILYLETYRLTSSTRNLNSIEYLTMTYWVFPRITEVRPGEANRLNGRLRRSSSRSARVDYDVAFQGDSAHEEIMELHTASETYRKEYQTLLRLEKLAQDN